MSGAPDKENRLEKTPRLRLKRVRSDRGVEEQHQRPDDEWKVPRGEELTLASSVADPKLFIPDPDPSLNFPSSGSRQKFRIHADPDQDPTCNNKVPVSIIQNNTKTPLKFNQN